MVFDPKLVPVLSPKHPIEWPPKGSAAARGCRNNKFGMAGTTAAKLDNVRGKLLCQPQEDYEKLSGIPTWPNRFQIKIYSPAGFNEEEHPLNFHPKGLQRQGTLRAINLEWQELLLRNSTTSSWQTVTTAARIL